MNATSNNRLILIGILLLAAVAAYLRFHCLGCLGFRWDEDLTALAVKALAMTGTPELPSGMIYTRFFPYQHLMAMSVNLLGFSEFSMRLPSVLFGLALIPLAWFVLSRILDRRIATIVAIAIGLSFMQVEMARTARMYAPFFVVFLIAAYAIWQSYYADRERLFSPWPLLLAMLALSIHQLAYSLALFLVLAIALNPTPRRTLSLVAQAGTIGVAFLSTRKLQDYFFYRAERLAGTDEMVQGPDGGGMLASVLAQISLPDLSLFSAVLGASGGQIVLGILGLFTALLIFWCIRGRQPNDWLVVPFTVATLAAAALYQFNLVAVLLGLYLIASRQGVAAMRAPIWRRLVIASSALLVTWLVLIYVFAATGTSPPGADPELLRQLIRRLVDYPNFRLFWSFLLEYPVLAPALLLGTLWGIDRMAQRPVDPAALFIVGGFWSVLFVNGILTTKFEFLRYNLHVDVLFLATCTTGVLFLPELLERLGIRKLAARNEAEERAWLISAGVILVLGVNPLAAFLTSHRDYHEDGAVYRALDLDSYQDFATPGTFVRDRVMPEDRIFVIDPREYWNYIGRVDYWIASDNFESQTYRRDGRHYDLYVGVPVLADVSSIRSTLREMDAGDAWFLFSRARVARTRSLTPALKAFFADLEAQVAFTGGDQETLVVRIGPDHALRRPAGSP
jgi:hypothetical protein